jgi:hypothetical protein
MSRESDKETGFLSRWSQRKLEQPDDSDKELAQQDNLTDKADEPLSNKDVEQTSEEVEQQKPIWQQDDVDADTKKAALRELFSKPEFNIRDGLNEYDDDFTQFASLGNIVTNEMKRMLKLAEEKTRPDQPDDEQKLASEDKQNIDPKNKEDDGVA